MNKPQFMHSPINGYLDCSQLRDVIKRVTMNILFGGHFFFLMPKNIYCFCYAYLVFGHLTKF